MSTDSAPNAVTDPPIEPRQDMALTTATKDAAEHHETTPKSDNDPGTASRKQPPGLPSTGRDETPVGDNFTSAAPTMPESGASVPTPRPATAGDAEGNAANAQDAEAGLLIEQPDGSSVGPDRPPPSRKAAARSTVRRAKEVVSEKWAGSPILPSHSTSSPHSDADETTDRQVDQGQGALETVDELREESKKIAIALQEAALASMKRNLAINTIARAAFYLGAAMLLTVVGYYLAVRFDAFVEAILAARGQEGPNFTQTLIAIAAPIVLGVVGSGIFVAIASLIQARSGSESAKALSQVSRLVRESPSVTGRSHALTQVLEETLANARQAFTIQLLISRVLFGTGVTLLFVFVASLFFGDTLASGGAAATSLLAFVASALLNPQRQIRSDLANVTQLAAILAGYTRQAGVIEEYLYQVLQQHKRTGSPDGAREGVLEGVDKLGKVLKAAMDNVGEYVQAPEQINPREVWLWQQLALRREEAQPDPGK